MGNNEGKWNKHYENLDAKHPDHYIDTDTYRLGAEWLNRCELIEDWGCGKGWFAYKAPDLNVRGIDGSQTPFAAEVVDLETYTSKVPGIFMRGVAEHNFEWKKILENLLVSFTERAFVSFFTPMEKDEAKQLTLAPGYDNIPDMSIPANVWEKMIKDSGATFTKKKIKSATHYGEETFYRIEAANG